MAALDHSEVAAPDLAATPGESASARAARVAAIVASRVPDVRFLLTRLLDDGSGADDDVRPTLFLAGDEDVMTPLEGIVELFERTPATKRMFVVKGADHLHFVDDVEESHESLRQSTLPGEAAWIPAAMRPLADLCPPEQAHETVRGLTLAHLDTTLRNDHAARTSWSGTRRTATARDRVLGRSWRVVRRAPPSAHRLTPSRGRGTAAPRDDRGHPGRVDGQPQVEAQIRAAQARGDFDDLPGKGKPLKLPEVHDPDWWIKSYVQREGIDTSALVHPTIALRREAGTFPESLAELTTEEQVRAVLEDFNRRVIAEWRRPLTGPSLPVVAHQVAVEPTIDRWRALRRESQAAEREVGGPTTLPDAAPQRGSWWRRLAACLTRGDAARTGTEGRCPTEPSPKRSGRT